MSALNLTTSIIGAALLGSGLYGVLAPASMARLFGVINVTRDMAVFYPGVGGRNFAAGLAVCALKYAGERKALGIFLCCWMCVGIADTYLLLKHYAEVDTVGLHVFNTFVLLVVGPALVRGG